MNADTRSKVVGRWAVRIAGLAVFFLFAAAPLPGETPGCEAPGEIDQTAALANDAAIRLLCAQHCYKDCERLVECGRYSGPAGGPGYAACVTDCTLEGRHCPDWTMDALCPLEVYGTGRVVTQGEESECLFDARNAACWCDPLEDCFAGGGLSVPMSCTAGGLCDPR
jgi:hypothetical protein